MPKASLTNKCLSHNNVTGSRTDEQRDERLANSCPNSVGQLAFSCERNLYTTKVFQILAALAIRAQLEHPNLYAILYSPKLV